MILTWILEVLSLQSYSYFVFTYQVLWLISCCYLPSIEFNSPFLYIQPTSDLLQNLVITLSNESEFFSTWRQREGQPLKHCILGLSKQCTCPQKILPWWYYNVVRNCQNHIIYMRQNDLWDTKYNLILISAKLYSNK